MFKLSEFLHFLKSPDFNQEKRVKTNILATSIKVYLVLLVFVIFANITKTLISKHLFTIPENKVSLIFETLKDHRWQFFIFVAILAPIIEEAIFRLSLVFKPIYFTISFSLLIAVIINRIASVIPAIISLLPLFFIFYYLTRHYKTTLQHWGNRYLGYLVYFSSLSFGLLHMGNYHFEAVYQYLAIPLLIFPQLTMGFLFSFVRLHYKNGIIICILVHIFTNTLSAIHFW